MKKFYSTDDENFYHDTVEDVLDALDCDGLLHAEQVYYEANCQPLTAPQLLRADYILEQADEIGHDLIGESWGSLLSQNRDAVEELQAALNAWAAKHVDLSRYYTVVGKTTERTVPPHACARG